MKFFINNINSLVNTHVKHFLVVLPIGISFFTFQQIAYLSDIYLNKYVPKEKDSFFDYALYVCFFPKLVAGPLVHYSDFVPQIKNCWQQKINLNNIGQGILLFSFGLAKKVIIADNLSAISRYAFDTANTLTFMESLCSSLCYTLQLYFDFSGYCDMALGCALLFGIHLPWNFLSPYKAANIQDFWRRWHITLSMWLRDYLYIPLGGNRRGSARTYCNVFVTFFLAGLWHGAAWTFVFWGCLHGCALIVHRIWARGKNVLPRMAGIGITFLFINLAWIVFLASDIACIKKFIDAFLFQNGVLFSNVFMEAIQSNSLAEKNAMLFTLPILLIVVFAAKNSRELCQQTSSLIVRFWALFLFVLSVLLISIPDSSQEFIYFQF